MQTTSKILTQEDLEIINTKFGIQLAYNDAVHYRAAQTIWNLWKAPESLLNAAETEE